MKNAYCVVTDIYYLPRSLVLYDSVENHLRASKFYFFCLDAQTEKTLTELGFGTESIVPREQFLRPYEEALAGRKQNEISWTCKPLALDYILRNTDGIDWAAYLDSDMLFFGDPGDALEWAGNDDYILTEHRFATPFFSKFGPLVGRYNAGFVAIKNSERGMRVLSWWKEQCLRSCPATPQPGLYSDQKYLDSFQEISGEQTRPNHPGLNVAPWNIGGLRVSQRQQHVYVDDFPLILYHFQGFKVITRHIYDYYSDTYHIPKDAVRHIYRPYAKLLHAKISEFHKMALPIATYKVGMKLAVLKAYLLCTGQSNLYVH